MRHTSMGQKAMMGPDWIPSGLVSRAIADLLTKETDRCESNIPSAPPEPPLPEPISLERPRRQRPKSAMAGSISRPRMTHSQSSGDIGERTRKTYGYNPLHLEHRVEYNRTRAYP